MPKTWRYLSDLEACICNLTSDDDDDDDDDDHYHHNNRHNNDDNDDDDHHHHHYRHYYYGCDPRQSVQWLSFGSGDVCGQS